MVLQSADACLKLLLGFSFGVNYFVSRWNNLHQIIIVNILLPTYFLNFEKSQPSFSLFALNISTTIRVIAANQAMSFLGVKQSFGL